MTPLADKIDARRAKAELKLELRAKKAEAARVERAAQAEAHQQQRAARAERRAATAAAIAAFGRRVLPALPVVMVSVFAVCGQIGAIFTYPPAGTPWLARVVIAVGAAVTLETIANYVAHQGHKALLAGAETEAARRRYAAYAVALLVAFINYSHFSGPGFAPTPAALMFALFSAAQPWLWGLHTRRELHGLLVRQGKNDDTGAVFSAARWRHFLWRTWLARRYSIDHGITDPRQAWEASEIERLERKNARAAMRQARRDARAAERQARAMAKQQTVPELELHEDVVTPDPEKVDDNGLSKFWQTAPAATTASAAKPARTVTPPKDVDLDKARELIANGAGRVVLQNELGVTEHTAKRLVKSLSVNGHRPS